MTKDQSAFSVARRRFLSLLGYGVAGTAIGSAVASDKVFAKQFTGKAAEARRPEMVYDPELQMMVDKHTGKPVFGDAKNLQLADATITAGCSNCPKRDD